MAAELAPLIIWPPIADLAEALSLVVDSIAACDLNTVPGARIGAAAALLASDAPDAGEVVAVLAAGDRRVEIA